MRCDKYREYWLGRILAEDFEAHRLTCDECRRAWELDSVIEELARDLSAPSEAPGLWERIAAGIESENRAARPSQSLRLAARQVFDPRLHPAWKLAAVLVLAVGIGSFHFLHPGNLSQPPRNLLTAEALARVEAVEMEYEQAIADLEAVADPLVTGADIELVLRYRDRLETIDAQIRKCRTVLAEDGANAHVRRYLLAAYHDKRETLTELLAMADTPSADGQDEREDQP